MYLFPAKLGKKVLEVIAQSANEFGYADVGFARDLFVFLYKEGEGLPNDKQLLKRIATYETKNIPGMSADRIGLVLRKRKMMLKELKNCGMLQAAVASDPSIIQRYRNLLMTMRKASYKKQLVACATCKYAAKDCAFAGKYRASAGSTLRNIYDPDYKKLVNPDCPAMPDLDIASSIGALASLVRTLSPKEIEELADTVAAMPVSDNFETGIAEDMVSVTIGDGSLTPPAESASPMSGHSMFTIVDDLVDKLSVADLVLYEYARKISTSLSTSFKGKYKPKAPKVVEKQNNQMSETKDVPHALPSELGQDDDIVELKIARKSMEIREDVGKEEKPQLLFVLIDSSGSMTSTTCQSSVLGVALISRAQIVTIFATALAKHVIEDKGEFAFCFFDSLPTRPFVVYDEKTLGQFLEMIRLQTFQGHSTNMDAALRLANDFIKKSTGKYSEAEILVMTDMDTSIADDVERQFVGPDAVVVNCLDVNPESSSWGNAREIFKKISRNYTKIDHNELDPKKVVSVIR